MNTTTMTNVAVFHNCYFSYSDNGWRVYDINDTYLTDYPSMWSDVKYFASYDDALAWADAQDYADLDLDF